MTNISLFLKISFSNRNKALHAQHHHAQFEMYEKLVKAQELIQKMEEEIECKNKTIHKLSLRQVYFSLFS